MMKEPVLADETNVEGYLIPLGGASKLKTEHYGDLMSENEVSRETLADPTSSAAYDEATQRCNKLLRSLPSLDSSVRFQLVWSIQEALDQFTNLTVQRDILTEAARNRIQVRKMQLAFAKIRAEGVLAALRQGGHAPSGFAIENARKASAEVSRAKKLLDIEGALVAEKMRLCASEVEQSRKAMADLKAAIEDTSVVPVPPDPKAPPPPRPEGAPFFYVANCKVGGHGARFAKYLLQRPDWRIYPSQVWFQDDKGSREYFCPLGRNLVDFADETKFSRVSMYIKGHIWMEDKTKLYEVAPDCIPETFVIDDQKWRFGKAPPSDDSVGSSSLPWFVKEADRNFGTSIHLCRKPSECMALAQPGAVYAVQQHIADPLCMDDGRKCHIKFYIFLRCLEDGCTWELHTYKDGYLSISPKKWSPEDLSKETQVTIIRSERIDGWRHWEEVYPKCKAKTARVIEQLVMQGKIQGTPGRPQFEIMSADYIVDTRGDVWMFEFNTSPVLKDPEDHPDVHDGDLIKGALSILLPWEGGGPGKWDLALRCTAPAPPAQ